MNMILKEQYVGLDMSCPFTGKIINTMFLNPNMYPHWIKRGFGYMFEEEATPEQLHDDYKSEIELDKNDLIS